MLERLCRTRLDAVHVSEGHSVASCCNQIHSGIPGSLLQMSTRSKPSAVDHVCPIHRSRLVYMVGDGVHQSPQCFSWGCRRVLGITYERQQPQ